MGCSESTQVLQNTNRSKPSFNVIEKIEGQQKRFFVLGEVNEGKFVWAGIDANAGTVNHLKIPQNYKPKNYSSMISIGENKYFVSGGINFSLNKISAQCVIFNVKDNSITDIQKMHQQRYTHNSIHYEGWVYVFGGRHFGDDDTAILQKCEKYSLSQRKWAKIPDMNVKRCTLFSIVWNERIYAFGGYTGECQRSKVIQYLQIGKQKQWKVLDVQLNRGVQSGYMLSTNENEVTIFGGNTNSGPSDTVVTINFKELRVHSNKKLKSQKMLHKGEYNNGIVYIFGGNDKLQIEQYDLKNLSTKTKDIGLKKQFSLQQFEAFTHPQNSVIVPYSQKPLQKIQSQYDDQIVYIFGTTQEPFILELNISGPYACYHSIPLSLTLHAFQGGISLKNKQFIFFGGISDCLENVSAQTYLYDHEKLQAIKLPSMSLSRYAFAYTQLNEYIYALGGGTTDQEGQLYNTKQCQRFNIQKKSWQKISDLPVGLISSMCLTYKEKLFLFGGMKENKQRFQNILRYDDDKDSWSSLKFSFPFGLQAGSIYQNSSNEFLIFGGRTVNGDAQGIWSLSFIGDSNEPEDCVFAEKSQMNEPKCLHKIYEPRHQNFLVIFGGEKYPLSYYDRETLKPMESDILAGMKQVFEENLSVLHHRSLKNYLILAKSQ